MCIKLTVHYKGCNCLIESLSPCPTFQKKRSGFWSSLLGAFKHEKHCGKVRRSRQTVESPCDDCAIEARGLQPHRVGDGANLPRRKVADEGFRKERPGAGRRSPKHKRRSTERRRHSGHSHHAAVPTNAHAWIPNLYDETKQVSSVPAPEYGRKYAPAPPVCPPRPSKDIREPTRPSSTSRRHREKMNNGGSHSRHGKSYKSSKPSTTSDYSTREDWPLRAPAEPRPALRAGGLRTQGPTGPPPNVPLPPLPKQARTFAQHAESDSASGTNRSQDPSYSRPVRTDHQAQRPTALPTSFTQEAFKHPLRREPRHVQRHPPPPLKIRPPARLPLYKECLAEQNSELVRQYGGWKPPAQHPMLSLKPKPAEPPRRSKLEAIGLALGFEHSSDSDSDVSFACVDARRVEAGQ
ncbi:hypothetical protein PG999_013416 [Apiospora kogelbergensis]|uniref:Uncharacterized protein n=1 Tax=Apiospora kogelbergensis TaxID=1337665 RepID=A0AAW0Q4F1_9PEZI